VIEVIGSISDRPLSPHCGRSRPHLGALLLGYYTDDGKLFYAGRAGTGMSDKVLAHLRRRLEPLVRTMMPLSAPPPRTTRFRSPLAVSRVHWVEPSRTWWLESLFDLDRGRTLAPHGRRA